MGFVVSFILCIGRVPLWLSFASTSLSIAFDLVEQLIFCGDAY
jgi:hypothetical protein